MLGGGEGGKGPYLVRFFVPPVKQWLGGGVVVMADGWWVRRVQLIGRLGPSGLFTSSSNSVLLVKASRGGEGGTFRRPSHPGLGSLAAIRSTLTGMSPDIAQSLAIIFKQDTG
jgi:hypothetical protein